MRLIDLTCNKATFRSVRFREGFNLILADRTASSASTDTRNGVGKTTLLQIIDFCLGGTIQKDDSLAKLKGGDWTFYLTIEVDSTIISIERAVDSTKIILTGDLFESGIVEEREKREVKLGPGQWSEWLGVVHFGLSRRATKRNYEPSFRGLVRHFNRFRKDAYIDPFKTFSSQPPVQVQTENAFLLGLNWEIASEWQEKKDRGKQIAPPGSRDDDSRSTLAELQARRARESSQLHRLGGDISSFRILPEYRNIEDRVNRLTREIREITNQMILTSQEISLYSEQLVVQTSDREDATVERLYTEVGIEFPDHVIRTIGEVRNFHAMVAENRASYLRAELRKLHNRQESRREKLESLEEQRQQDMSILEAHGALEEYALLQQRYGTLAASIALIDGKIAEVLDLRHRGVALKSEILELQETADIDLQDRQTSVSGIISRFSEIFEDLYGEPADLLIDTTQAGYRFRVNLPRRGSTGTNKMGIFAYDMAVAEAWARPVGAKGLGFLAHDSVLFDGVDERQTAEAVAMAAISAESFHYQYILTANSDDLTTEEFDRVGVSLQDYEVLRLTDARVDGGILGIRV